MSRPRLLPAMLVSLALGLTSGPASAVTVTIKCGSKEVTVSGEKKCGKGDLYDDDDEKVGEYVECTDNQGNSTGGSCMNGKASCDPIAVGKTSCRTSASILPTPPPPRIPGQRPGMPPAGILEGGLGGFGPQGPAPTGAPTAPPAAPPVVR